MKTFRNLSEFLGKILSRTIVVSGDSDNVAGLCVALNFSLYWARINKRPVIFIYRPIYFPSIFKRIKIHSLKKKHAIFDIVSPFVDSNPSFLLRHTIGNLMGLCCFVKFIFDLAKYKLNIVDQVLNYPRYIFGPDKLFDLDYACAARGMNPSEIIEENYQIDLNEKDKIDCQRNIYNLGLTEKKFVCLHIRTRHYKGTMDKENSGFRNASPESYIPAIKHLIAKGLTVVRLGDKVDNLLPAMSGYVDYANSEYKSEKMDIYLIKNCYFYFGTNSGIYDLAVLLRTPMLTVNVTEMLAAKPFHKLDIMIYKRIKRVGSSEPLSMKDYLNLRNPISLEEFDFVDNSPEDLVESIDQMLENLSGQQRENDEIHDEFVVRLDRAVVRWANIILSANNGPTYMNEKDESDRIKSYGHYNGRVGREFVRKYYH